MTTRRIKQSETRTIRRSQIRFNPYNPKRHAEKSVMMQKKNLQKVGNLGGIVWNERTGNLVDGHRRVMAMDLFYKYDGTESADYDVQVSVADFDEKTEKEQLAYMAAGNTKPDIDLLAEFVPDIDFHGIGLSTEEINDIFAISTPDIGGFDSPLDGLMSTEGADGIADTPEEKSYDEKKEHMKDVKRQVREQTERRLQDENAYITLSFSTYQAKEDFCDMLGICTDDKYAKGEDVLELIS